MEVASRAADANRQRSPTLREPSPTPRHHPASALEPLRGAGRRAVRTSLEQWLSCCSSRDVRVSARQEPGESGRGADVICEAPCRPPGGHACVRDDVAVNRVLNAVSSERTNDDPWRALESEN